MTQSAILFVIVVGTAPVVASRLIPGAAYLKLILIRVGRILGAGGPVFWCQVVIRAALPA